jgi:hypothetical protein
METKLATQTSKQSRTIGKSQRPKGIMDDGKPTSWAIDGWNQPKIARTRLVVSKYENQ